MNMVSNEEVDRKLKTATGGLKKPNTWKDKELML